MGLDRVAVASPHSPAGDVAGVGQFTDDAVGSAFGDPDRVADLTQADARIMCDAEQHLGMVGEE